MQGNLAGESLYSPRRSGCNVDSSVFKSVNGPTKNLYPLQQSVLPLMIANPSWQTMTSAPRDGALLLLFAPELVRAAGMPRDRRVHNQHVVVGRWHVPERNPKKADWVTDIRSITYEGEQAHWEADMIAPTHWLALPAPPPEGEWRDADSPPLAYEYVLLYVPQLGQAREYPMNAPQDVPPSFDMVVGCCVGSYPSWLTDVCEADEIAGGAEDLSGDLSVSASTLWPSHWMPLPTLP